MAGRRGRNPASGNSLGFPEFPPTSPEVPWRLRNCYHSGFKSNPEVPKKLARFPQKFPASPEVHQTFPGNRTSAGAQRPTPLSGNRPSLSFRKAGPEARFLLKIILACWDLGSGTSENVTIKIRQKLLTNLLNV